MSVSVGESVILPATVESAEIVLIFERTANNVYDLTVINTDPKQGLKYHAVRPAAPPSGKFKFRTCLVLRKLSKSKDQPAIAMAATYAICGITGPEKHLDKLAEYLNYPERGMACSAAEFLGKLGPKASAAVPALEAAFRNNDRVPGKKGKGNRDYHIRGACQNALRKIVPGWKLSAK